MFSQEADRGGKKSKQVMIKGCLGRRPSKFNMQAVNEHYKMKRDDRFELALHLPGDEVAFNLSSLTSD